MKDRKKGAKRGSKGGNRRVTMNGGGRRKLRVLRSRGNMRESGKDSRGKVGLLETIYVVQKKVGRKKLTIKTRKV